jgi:type II secretory pathway pseudopilin PulG
MMKKSMKTMLGVTLLEIMLVLAIAAMVIVLSIRYYQSASYSSQANQLMSAFQSITAAAENLAQTSGTYTGISQPQIATIVPTNTFIAPWSSTLTFTPSAASFTITVPNTPAGVCTIMSVKLSSDKHTLASTTSCGTAAATFTYNYVLSP